MNKTTHRVTAHQPQQPQNDEYDRYCPQHVILPFFPRIPPADYCRRPGENRLLSQEPELLDGH